MHSRAHEDHGPHTLNHECSHRDTASYALLYAAHTSFTCAARLKKQYSHQAPGELCVHVSVLIGWIPGACRHGRSFRVSAQQGQSGEGKRITQNEFTDKAWQSIIAAPDIAKQVCLLSSSRCLLRLLLQQWGLLIHLPTQGP